MILYFSGTGNSLYAAKKIAEASNERLISIAAAAQDKLYEFDLSEHEMIGFVFPVYAWAPPAMVVEYINKLKLNGSKENYAFAVATCGSNIGNTMKVLQKALSGKGISLQSAFSLVMPNNYMIMGDVYSSEKQKSVLDHADKALQRICDVIDARQTGVFELEKGIWSFIGTSIINPMFTKHAIRTDKFYTKENCNGCGICEKVCTCGNISVDKRPKWGNHCSQCLACINYCPMHAIQFGSGTEKKGRYINPYIKVSEMML